MISRRGLVVSGVAVGGGVVVIDKSHACVNALDGVNKYELRFMRRDANGASGGFPVL